MSSSDSNRSEKKRKTDYFEIILWTVATIIVAMLAAHWVGLY